MRSKSPAQFPVQSDGENQIVILEVVRGFGRGGAERALVNRLSRAPENVTTYIFNSAGMLDGLANAPHSHARVERPFNLIRQIRAFTKLVKRVQPTVVVARTPYDLIIVRLSRVFKTSDYLLIYEAHSEFITQKKGFIRISGTVFDWSMKCVNEVFAVSRAVTKGHLCRASHSVSVVPLGCKVNPNPRLMTLTHTGPTLVYLGRFDPLKRVPWIIDRVNELRSELRELDARVYVVGDGPERSAILAAVEKYRLDDLVTVRQWMEFPEELLATADILVVASKSEGMPLVAVEAKRLGLRIVSTPLAGVMEICDEDDFVNPSWEPKHYSEALLAAVSLWKVDDQRRQSKWKSTEHLDERVCAANYYRHIFGLVQDQFNDGASGDV